MLICCSRAMPVDNVFGITIKDGTAVIDSGPGVLRRNSATDKSCKFPSVVCALTPGGIDAYTGWPFRIL